MKGYSLILCVFVVQLALGDHSDVYYWRPNSNWNNPSNWELGSPPCGNQVASIPDNSVIYLKEDVSVQTLILPENGQIILGANVAVTISEDASCGADGPGTNPAPASGPSLTNGFIGNSAHYWECSDNWLTSDNLPAEHPPCGEDIAEFEEDSYFHYVLANETIYVSSLKVRGQQINSKNQLDAREFQLDINIVPGCDNDPSQCPCPSDQGCVKPTGITVAARGSNAGMIAGIVVGILIGLLVLVAVIVIVIVAIIMYKRRSTVGLYNKDELLDCDEDQSDGKEVTTPTPTPTPRTFENPVYQSTTIASGDMQLTSNQEKPKLDFQVPDDSTVTLGDAIFEVIGDPEPSPRDEEFVKVDLEALEVALGPGEASPTEAYVPREDVDAGLVEEVGKSKKGKKSGKYERF